MKTCLMTVILLSALTRSVRAEDAPPTTPPAPLAAASPAPSSGIWYILAGSGLGAAGVVNLATAPLCTLSAIRSSAQPACVATSVAFGVALLGAGVPLVVLGAKQRAVWSSWKAGAGAVPSGAVMTLTGRF